MRNIVLDHSALRWEEATPIGNGSFGAMVYGRENKEIIQLNEETLWSGKVIDDTLFNIEEHVRKARMLIDNNKFKEAERYINANMLGHPTNTYLPLGNVIIDFKHKEQCEDYQRELDLEKGLLHIKYHCDKEMYERTYFCSHVDDLMIMHIQSSRFGSINCSVVMDSFLRHEVATENSESLSMTGEAPIHVEPTHSFEENVISYHENQKGIAFATVIKAVTDGVVSASGNSKLTIQYGSYVTLYIASKTNFINSLTIPDSSRKNPLLLCREIIDRVIGIGYEQVKKNHINDFSSLMNRVELSLDSSTDELTIEERILGMKEKEELDPILVEQLFQLGRYLIVSSSREGKKASTLQGIWNCMIQPPWCSNYTLNINTEMNYWPVDVANLSICFKPLGTLVKNLQVTGRKAAKALGCDGWTANHVSDVWGHTIPINRNAQFAFWPLGGPWLTVHLFEHYLFTQDMEYLSEIYPIMKESAYFCLDWCYMDQSGYLVTGPSTSPENSYLLDDGTACCITKASTMDMTIIWELWSRVIIAIDELGMKEEQEFKQKLKEARDKLYPYKIDSKGRIQEWWDERECSDKGHRHVSHLIGLFPGHRVDCDKDKVLLKAHYESLEERVAHGSGHTSWSCLWIMLLYARLRNNERVGDMLLKYCKYSLINNGLSTHPPFQIDGNFGFTAAVCETLLQSNNDYIELLPALPNRFHTGRFSGLKARGGYEISAIWENCIVTEVTVKPIKIGLCRLKINNKIIQLDCQDTNQIKLDKEALGRNSVTKNSKTPAQ